MFFFYPKNLDLNTLMRRNFLKIEEKTVCSLRVSAWQENQFTYHWDDGLHGQVEREL